jgi:KUP system potassium uptake protein
MAPSWALYPLVILATVAASIASQAIITGAYSLTLQAIQLGYTPRLNIRHTSAHQIGQIYVPAVNWTLMIACIALVLGFHSSSNLAAAYGVAITMTMVITTILFYVLIRQRWQWSRPVALAVTGLFLIIDLSFFGANITKIAYGGWFPLAVAGLVFLIMSTWQRGRQMVASRLRHRLIPLELFLADLLSDPPMRVPGTAVFMSGNPIGTPPALRHNFVHNKVLHATVVIVSVETAEIPHVPAADRYSVEEIGEGFWRVMIRYGFMEEPNIPRALVAVRHPQLSFKADEISYFLGRETLLPTRKPGMARWREHLFVWLSRNAQTATDFFNLPPDRVVEVGVQVEL